MIANMSAFALARYWRHTPIYEALLEQDGISLDQRHRPQDPGDSGELPVEELGMGGGCGNKRPERADGAATSLAAAIAARCCT